ncbi:hypothetical protein [Pedobacter endophyticus]|uniref:Fasciclin domain-containing protein n=1 Tax=Pedobacter endophyticus TaxID=2789740 RepID=A0A7S9L292_9SPHI|nr:hypothetical protein [Pedobacter endophyticus]QPH41160.1 hypothetical protein IZT61_07845 [Pedobacter endophyticus]
MKNLLKIKIGLILFTALIVIACKKDYYQDGGLSAQSEAEKNMTTYDFLASRTPGKFDSLLKVIDLTGTKNLVNQDNITFYAVPNSGVARFQSMFSSANKLIRPLNKIGKDTLTMLLKRLIIPNSHISLEQAVSNVRTLYKDANNDTLFISFKDGGVKPGTAIQTSAYSMVYEHRKIPKVDSVNYVSLSAFQTHNLITKNAMLHVVAEETNFATGLKTKFYLY